MSWGSPGSAGTCLRAAGAVRRVSIAQPDLGLFQVYMFKCVWRCYRLIKCMNSAEEKSSSKMLQKVSLGGFGERWLCHSLCPLGKSLSLAVPQFLHL